jgi:hypothetical protein
MISGDYLITRPDAGTVSYVKALLSIIGPLIVTIGFIPYLLDTVRGSVRPRIASWATWSLVTGIVTVAALSQGAYTSAVLTGMGTCVELLILIMALRKGDYTYTWVDGASQTISLLGICAWLLSKDATFAIIFSIVADGFGAVPTFYHAWVAPHEEAWPPFVLGGVGATVSLVAVGTATFVAVGFPIYLVAIGFALGLSIYIRQRVVPIDGALGREVGQIGGR